MVTSSQESTNQLAQQVRDKVGYALLDGYGLLEITGQDAQAFLQAQTTNDVFQLQPNMGQASALLDRKAHLQAYFSLHALKENYLILAESAQIPTIIDHLERVHFTEAVSFSDQTAHSHYLTLQGPQSWPLLQALGLQKIPESTLSEYGVWEVSWQGTSILIFKRSLTGETGFILAIPEQCDFEAFLATLVNVGKAFNLQQMTQEVQETLRIEAGIPLFDVDMDSDLMLPQAGLEQSCVSYTKGCYPGQEVVAKVKTYGSVSKALIGLVLDRPIQETAMNTDIHLGTGEVVGQLKSYTNSPTLNAPIALVYLNRDYRVPNKELDLVILGKQYHAKVHFLPFYSPLSATDMAQQKYDLALRKFAENDEEQAIVLLREAIELNPHFADAYESLGVVLSRQGQYEEAIALMQKLAELNPDDVMAHTNLSVFYMKLGMKEEAEVEKAKATTLSFKKAMAEKSMVQAQAETEKQQKAALESKIAMFQEVLAIDPEDALANYGLGNTYVTLKEFTLAVPHLKKAIEADPKYTVAYLALGKALEGLGQASEAKSVFEQGVEVAAKRGDLMPMQDMQRHLSGLS